MTDFLNNIFAIHHWNIYTIGNRLIFAHFSRNLSLDLVFHILAFHRWDRLTALHFNSVALFFDNIPTCLLRYIPTFH